MNFAEIFVLLFFLQEVNQMWRKLRHFRLF